MAYQTGAASDIRDLIKKIAAFAITNGWIQDGSTIEDEGANRTDLSLHTGPNYIRMIADTNDSYGPIIYLYGGSGFENPALTDQSNYSGCNFASAPVVEYHLFCTNQYIHCAFLCGNGSWNNIMMGVLEKVCAYEGGTYVAGTSFGQGISNNQRGTAYSSYHAFPFDGRSTSQYGGYGNTEISYTQDDVFKWASFWSSGNGLGGYREDGFTNVNTPSPASKYSIQALLMSRSVNNFNGLTILHPFIVGVLHTSPYYTFLGSPKDVRIVNIKHMNAKDIITIGGDQWKVFPARNKTYISVTDCFSEYIGYAYLVNPA